MSTYIVWAVVAVVFFAILYKMAGSRGRNPILWGVLGAAFTLVALIVLLVVGRSDDYQPASS